LINFLNNSKELTDSFYGVYENCISTSEDIQVEKITSDQSSQVNFSCNTQLCAPDSQDYNITVNGKTILTAVNYPTERIIIDQGLNRKIRIFCNFNDHYIR
jgi:hypothetical protein